MLTRTWLMLLLTSWGLNVTSGYELEMPRRQGGTKTAKGRGVSKGRFGERSGKENDPRLEINRVMWSTAQLAVSLEIRWAESQTVWWFWVRSFPAQHQRTRSSPGTEDDSLPCFPSPLLEDINIRYHNGDKNHVARWQPGSLSLDFVSRQSNAQLISKSSIRIF